MLPFPTVNTADLNRSERLLILRRRERESQKKAAARHGVSLYMYRCWEDGKNDPPRASIGKLKPHENCFLRRRRAGMSLSALARELDCVAWWACQMEYGRVNADRLVAYWTKKDRPWRRPGRRQEQACRRV